MPMKRETGKDRWRRIPKDYFKTRDRLQGAKLRLSGVAMVLSLAWVALGVDWRGSKNPLTSTDANSLRANHGTLARVHAAWDNKCDACHVPFEPIDGRGMFASASSPTSRSSDKLCMTCHAGPSHHSAMIESEVKTCAECHRDHQGRDFSLVRLSDNECTNCHAELDAHVDTAKKPPGSRMYGKVARFDEKAHPAFTPEAAIKVGDKLQDRGKLKFNHAQHMTLGIVKKPGDTPYTIDKIPLVSERARYQKAGPASDAVQLDCSSCHQLDATEAHAPANPAVSSATLPVRNSGQYYLPVTYEGSCRACHALTFDPAMKDVEVPHGVQPGQVAEFLRRTYASQALTDDFRFSNAFVSPVRLPGKSTEKPDPRKQYQEAVAHALAFMFPKDVAGQGANANNCLECHSYGKDEVEGLPTRVEPTNVPQVWFTHAAFDHTAHRGVSCRECHARSYALGEDGVTPIPDASVSSLDVLIPGIDNCVQCHAPPKASGGWLASFTSPSAPTTGGASFDCTECHRYHNGDRTLQGYGATAQNATLHRSIAEFLEGEGGLATKSPKP